VALGCGDGASSSDGGFDAARLRDARVVFDDAADLAPAPDFAPALESRVLLLVETSDAMTVIDQGDNRALTVAALLGKHAGQPFPMFAVVGWSSTIELVTPGFTSTPDIAAINKSLSRATELTDDEGALDLAIQQVEKDALAIPPEERMRTHYTVAMLSGSRPAPECDTGAVPCGNTTCTPGNICRIGACSGQPEICTIPRDQWSMLQPAVSTSLYPSLMAGMDYNTAARVTAKVQALTALAAKDQIGGVSFDTALVFDPKVQGDPLLQPFQLDRGESTAFLKSLAQAGGGNFYDLAAMPMLPY
jgi:hypothetical protein